MSGVANVRYWISTVSREHALIGRDGGFCQVCHGKKGPLARMKKDDWIVHYSPKMSMDGKELCQKFTAIGKIADDNIFQFEMNKGFIPFRRNVIFLQTAKEQSIYPLLEEFSFTKGQKNWGAKFRFGLFEISKEDFNIIFQKMVDETKPQREHEDKPTIDRNPKRIRISNVKEKN